MHRFAAWLQGGFYNVYDGIFNKCLSNVNKPKLCCLNIYSNVCSYSSAQDDEQDDAQDEKARSVLLLIIIVQVCKECLFKSTVWMSKEALSSLCLLGLQTSSSVFSVLLCTKMDFTANRVFGPAPVLQAVYTTMFSAKNWKLFMRFACSFTQRACLGDGKHIFF